MRRYILLVSILSCVTGLYAQKIFDNPLSDRVTGYKMDVRLDQDAKTISGKLEAYWVNRSGDIVPDIWLHMYLNAFRSNKSTFYKESGGSPGSEDINYGWVKINAAFDRQGRDLSKAMRFMQPDDGNPDDMSVLKIDLPVPAAPGDTVFLVFDFTSKLPSNIRRTGFVDNYFFVAQWFPKIGVYETAGMRDAMTGAWNCHQFHANSEFYANHSTYDVKITLPQEYVVGTGGLLVDEVTHESGMKTLTYRAEDIVDFAWTAWPYYRVAEDQWEHIKITFLYPPGRDDQVPRQMEALKNALQYLKDRVGPFPWPHLTFVDPPSKAAGAGGMEYTTIFTSISSARIPEFIHLPQMVTIHEFGHGYFMGILASNEFEEPWLDEGVNSYWEGRIMDHYYGPNKGIMDHPKFWFSDRSFLRSQYVFSTHRQVTDNSPPSWEYPHGTYGMMSYQKAATWLNTLEGIIGTETMDEVFRQYYREWGFKHPTASDFIEVTNRVVKRIKGDTHGPDMNWFFDQTLYGTGICDYKVSGISNHKIRAFRGIVESDSGMVLRKDDTSGDTIFVSKVSLERLGEVMLPVELLVHFKSGKEQTRQWDGKSRYRDFEFNGPDEIEWARIDPDMKNYMDVNLLNNSYTLEPDQVPLRKVSRSFVTLVMLLSHLLSL